MEKVQINDNINNCACFYYIPTQLKKKKTKANSKNVRIRLDGIFYTTYIYFMCKLLGVQNSY